MCRSAEADGLPALVVRSGSAPGPPSVLCLVGAPGSGKSSLAYAIARALGRTAVTLPLLGEGLRSLIRGQRGIWLGRVVQGLIEAKVQNPVFILEGIDKIAEDFDKNARRDADEDKDYRERVESMLAVLDPSHRAAFQDAFLQFPLDLSGVLWIATAIDPTVIPAEVRDCLHVVDLPVYTEQEKVAIAEEHLLRRPFDGVPADSAGVLAPDLASSVALVPPAASSAALAGPVVIADRVVSSAEELSAFPARSAVPEDDVASESWRTAAVRGDVRFEPDAIRLVISDYTSEPGVRDLERSLAEICRQVVRRRPPAVQGPDVVTSSIVPMFLGDADVDPLPLAVRQAIEDERRRLSADSSTGSSLLTSSWIEWLENVPWNKRNDAAIDLARIREVLDARQAGLDDAKAMVVEYLAVRKRNPRGTGAVLCFLGPPGVGKTALAQSVAQALGRKYARVPCGGMRDPSDLRGHNRTWHKSQPGSIIRELRRVGYRDPVLVLDEVDKIGPAPAAVLLEVLDPEQQGRFRDAFLELPFNLSEVIFIATANDWDRIPPPLRDRLEVVELSAYTEQEKLAIARTHLVPAENRAAGLLPTPVGITDGALRQLIREHTSEPGIRQLSRCVRTVWPAIETYRHSTRPCGWLSICTATSRHSHPAAYLHSCERPSSACQQLMKRKSSRCGNWSRELLMLAFSRKPESTWPTPPRLRSAVARFSTCSVIRRLRGQSTTRNSETSSQSSRTQCSPCRTGRSGCFVSFRRLGPLRKHPVRSAGLKGSKHRGNRRHAAMPPRDMLAGRGMQSRLPGSLQVPGSKSGRDSEKGRPSADKGGRYALDGKRAWARRLGVCRRPEQTVRRGDYGTAQRGQDHAPGRLVSAAGTRFAAGQRAAICGIPHAHGMGSRCGFPTLGAGVNPAGVPAAHIE